MSVTQTAQRSDVDDAATLKRLLVGVDGSDASGAACSFALRLAGKADAQVLLLHACAELELAAHAAHAAPAELLVAAAEQRLAETGEWQRRLQNLAAYAADGAMVETRVVRDRPAAALLGAASEFGSDLVLVGSRGVGALRGTLLGSVSWQVVEHAPCSVMVFRETQPTAHVRSVVVGVDGSPGAAIAVSTGERLAAAVDAELVLVHAHHGPGPLASETSRLRARLQERIGAEILAAADRSLRDHARLVAAAHEGHARQALVEVCERLGPAILVVGTRGLGGFEGLLLGSTSRWVLNHATCPVLVARGRRDP